VKEKHSPKVAPSPSFFMFLDSSITYDSLKLFQLKHFTNSCYTNVCEGKIRGTKSEVIKNVQGMYPTDMPGTL